MTPHQVFWTIVAVSFAFGFIFGYAFRFATDIRNAINELKKPRYHDTYKQTELQPPTEGQEHTGPEAQ